MKKFCLSTWRQAAIKIDKINFIWTISDAISRRIKPPLTYKSNWATFAVFIDDIVDEFGEYCRPFADDRISAIDN